MMAEENEKDYTIYHDLTQKLKKITEEPASTNLVSKIHGVGSKYLHENKDSVTGLIKWSDETEKHRFTDAIWDSAADHIAENYLKLEAGDIKKLKSKKDPDGMSLFETMIASYLGGVDKKRLFEQIESLEDLSAENLMNYIEPIFKGHISYRHTVTIDDKIKTHEQASGLHEYLKQVKKHNPESFKGIKIPGYKGIDTTKNLLGQLAGKIPYTYHPHKKETYEVK